MPAYQDMLIELRTELANLHIREHQIGAAIASLERLNGQGSIRPNGDESFRGVSYGDAARELITRDGPLRTRDLAERMLQGGVRTKARNFVATLYSLLYKDGRFRLIDRRWHLKETSGSPQSLEAA